MIRRIAPLLLLSLALGSCTAPEVPVEAYADGGGVAFRVDASQLDTANCFVYFDILDAHGKVMWSLASERVSGPAEDCPRTFPLRYGVAPRGVLERVAPAPLTAGQLYVVYGHATGEMVGAFRIGADARSVEPLDADIPAARAARDNYQEPAGSENVLEPAVNATAN